MVAFWEYQEAPLPLKPVCLGFFIRPDWIFVTTNCADKLETFQEKPHHTVMSYGGHLVRKSKPEFTSIVKKQQVDPLSKFSIVFVSNFTIH